jgi:hypothetical protein
MQDNILLRLGAREVIGADMNIKEAIGNDKMITSVIFFVFYHLVGD